MPYRKVRPQPHEKAARNQAVVEYQRAHPEATMGDIGLIFACSRQRIYAILKRAKKPSAEEGRYGWLLHAR